MELMVLASVKGALLEGEAPNIIQRGLDGFVEEAANRLLVEVKKRTPAGFEGNKGGEMGLRGSIRKDVLLKGTPVVKGVVGTTAKHALAIEKGRRPGGRIPPEGVLLDWIQFKLKLSGAEAKRADYLIRRKIAKEGFDGVHMFERALAENERWLEDAARKHGLKIVTELSQ